MLRQGCVLGQVIARGEQARRGERKWATQARQGSKQGGRKDGAGEVGERGTVYRDYRDRAIKSKMGSASRGGLSLHFDTSPKISLGALSTSTNKRRDKETTNRVIVQEIKIQENFLSFPNEELSLQ